MDQSQPAGPARFGGRYELTTEDAQGRVEAIDHEPWRKCWACGSTDNLPNEAFCSNCGASLEKRTYRGSISPADQPDGLVLVPQVTDEFAQATLPKIWDQVEDDERILVLLEPDDTTRIEPPVDELTALRVGHGLARLLAALHIQEMALGTLTVADLALTTDGQPCLLHAPDLRTTSADTYAGAVQDDLQMLAELLEELTATPRTTRRLSNDRQEIADWVTEEGELSFARVLSQIRTGAIASAAELEERLADLLADRTRPQALRQRYGALSNTGIVRDHNEDSLLVLDLSLNNKSLPHTCGLYIVADGMGGHAAGEVASGLAVRSTAESLLSSSLTMLLDVDADFDQNWLEDMLARAVLQANEAVRREGYTRGNDMGTTITTALVIGDRALIANVGDSRTYLFRDNQLQRISRDHSLVMRLVELGQLNENDIYTHPQRNAVLRSLGDQGDIEVDLFVERLQPGDALLLCSDGQWEMTRDPEMVSIITAHDDPQRACQELISAANQAGGEDNITSILVRFETVEP